MITPTFSIILEFKMCPLNLSFEIIRYKPFTSHLPEPVN